MIIKLVVNCPNCGKEIIKIINFIGDEPEIHVTCFEQENWHCARCDEIFSSGDFELWNIKDL